MCFLKHWNDIIWSQEGALYRNQLFPLPPHQPSSNSSSFIKAANMLSSSLIAPRPLHAPLAPLAPLPHPPLPLPRLPRCRPLLPLCPADECCGISELHFLTAASREEYSWADRVPPERRDSATWPAFRYLTRPCTKVPLNNL